MLVFRTRLITLTLLALPLFPRDGQATKLPLIELAKKTINTQRLPRAGQDKMNSLITQFSRQAKRSSMCQLETIEGRVVLEGRSKKNPNELLTLVVTADTVRLLKDNGQGGNSSIGIIRRGKQGNGKAVGMLVAEDDQMHLASLVKIKGSHRIKGFPGDPGRNLSGIMQIHALSFDELMRKNQRQGFKSFKEAVANYLFLREGMPDKNYLRKVFWP